MVTSSNIALKRKFGGKEYQDELNLAWYDVSARNYDPAIGRWFVIDALADAPEQIFRSPYQYAWNNPVYYNDPDGNCPGCDLGILFGSFMGQTRDPNDGYAYGAGAMMGAANGAVGLFNTLSNPVATLNALGALGNPYGGYYEKYSFYRGVKSDVTAVVSGNGFERGEVIGRAGFDTGIGAAIGGPMSAAASRVLSGVTKVTRVTSKLDGGLPEVPDGLSTINSADDIFTQIETEALRVHPNVNSTTLKPGPYADKSIPGTNSRNFSKSQREAINEIGNDTGCHTCGTTDAGTKSGNFILDHQPGISLAPQASKRLFPHCTNCSSSQGGTMGGLIRKGYNPNNIIIKKMLDD